MRAGRTARQKRPANDPSEANSRATWCMPSTATKSVYAWCQSRTHNDIDIIVGVIKCGLCFSFRLASWSRGLTGKVPGRYSMIIVLACSNVTLARLSRLPQFLHQVPWSSVSDWSVRLTVLLGKDILYFWILWCVLSWPADWRRILCCHASMYIPKWFVHCSTVFTSPLLITDTWLILGKAGLRSWMLWMKDWLCCSK